MSAPLCECHGAPKSWQADPRKRSGGYWRCSVKKNAANRRYEASDHGKARKRRWRENNWEKVGASNARRLYVGGMYLGMVGFTQREREELTGRASVPATTSDEVAR